MAKVWRCMGKIQGKATVYRQRNNKYFCHRENQARKGKEISLYFDSKYKEIFRDEIKLFNLSRFYEQ